MLAPWLGQDFFPSVDAGQFIIHVRAHTGTRIEETAALCDQVEQTIREQIPANELATIVDNIGLPYSSLNLSYSTSAPVGSVRCRHPGAAEARSSSHARPMSSACAACWPANTPA